jgi:hypothetical protein
MTTFMLDLNDSELRVARVVEGRPKVVAQTTGFALINEHAIVLGEPALQQFRLHPRQASNQFWNRLNNDALPVRGPDTANFADLVYRQLKELAQQAQIGGADELHIAVPGTTTADQLGLLVGIAAEIGVSVTGLVDSAVAASALYTTREPLLCIDVHLHRAVLTEVGAADGPARQRIQEVAELGLAGLMEAWINVIADRFVRDTRFDPLSIATTDQQLYSQLYDWLTHTSRSRDLAVEIDHQSTLRRTDLTLEALTAKVAPRYRLLDHSAGSAHILLSHRAARLPGLPEHLLAHAASVKILDSMAVFNGLAAHQQRIRSDPAALRLVTRLPKTDTPNDVAAAPSAAPHRAAMPTHVLFGSDAVEIVDALELNVGTFADLPTQFPRGVAQLRIVGDSVRLHLKDGAAALVNGRTARSDTAIEKGCIVEIGGARFLFIQTRTLP